MKTTDLLYDNIPSNKMLKEKKTVELVRIFCGKRNWLWILQLWFDACSAHNTLSVCNMIERNGSSWCTFIMPIFLLFCCFSFILNTFIVVSWGSVCVYACISNHFYLIFSLYFVLIIATAAAAVAVAVKISFFIHTSSHSNSAIFCSFVYFS